MEKETDTTVICVICSMHVFMPTDDPNNTFTKCKLNKLLEEKVKASLGTNSTK